MMKEVTNPAGESREMENRDLVAAARGLADLVASGAEDAERARTLPARTIEAIDQSNLFALLVPAELSGCEADPVTFIEVVEEISRADGSTGWCLANGAICAGMAGAHLGEKSARDIFAADRPPLFAGGFTPRGRALPEASGFRIDGRWPLGSGCRHADFLIATCVVLREGRPRMLATGMPEARVCVVPRERVEIHDNWHAAGLEGTASCDYSVVDHFISEDGSFPLDDSAPRRGGALYRVPLMTWAAMAQAGFALGVGRRALDEIAARARDRIRLGTSEALARRGAFQEGFGRVTAKLRAARLLVFDAFGEVWESVRAGRRLTAEQRASALLAAVHANRTASAACSFAFHAAGAGAVFRSDVLQRCFRDIHAARQHIVVGDESFERAAQVLLGLGAHPML